MPGPFFFVFYYATKTRRHEEKMSYFFVFLCDFVPLWPANDSENSRFYFDKSLKMGYNEPVRVNIKI